MCRMTKGASLLPWTLDSLLIPRKLRIRVIFIIFFITSSRPTLLSGCLQMGCAPALDWLLDMTPVDFVSCSILLLSQFLSFDFKSSSDLSTEPLCPIFHLCNPAPIHWSRFVDWMRTYGYALQKLPYTEWRQRLIAVSREAAAEQTSTTATATATSSSSAIEASASANALSIASSVETASPVRARRHRTSSTAGGAFGSAAADNALLPLLPIFSENEVDMGTTQTMPKFDASLTLRQCEALGVPCPPINANLLKVYFEFYISSGFLPPPHTSGDQFSIDA